VIKWEYEGQRLERFAWTMVVLAVIGALSAAGWVVLSAAGWVVWGVWKWIS